MKLTKWRLASAILATVLLGSTAAYATHVFDDVPDDAFYADPVEWAFDNAITTGKSPTQFAPLDNVTRGETVTFLQRYDTNIVQPALEGLQADADAAQAAADANAAAMPTIYHAWVSSTGTSSTKSEGVTTTQDGTGTYTVVFPEDVTACTWQVSRRTSSGIFVFDPDATARPVFSLFTRTTGFFPNLTSHPTDIRVTVVDEAGDPGNTPFDLTVICP